MLHRTLIAPALLATLALAACENASTDPSTATLEDDYAIAMFGEAGSALEGTMGPQAGRPFDGRSGHPLLPPDLALSEEQKAEIQALREAFRTEHIEALEALKAVFMEARAARQAGATRLEVREILIQGREIAQGLRPAVIELWQAIWDVLTEEQQAWLIEHRPRRFPPPIAQP